MNIIFAHVRNYNNSGDMACCPYQYFESYFKRFNCKFLDISDALPYDEGLVTSNDCVIIGGGGLDGYHEVWQRRINALARRAKIAIGWGFGSNRNSNRVSNVITDIDYGAFDLFGNRDFKEDHGRYLPCVSCMHPAFTKSYQKKRKNGVIIHKDYPINSLKLPSDCEIVCNAMNVDRLIEFIGSSESIYSNSYHANYWSALLNVPSYRIDTVTQDSRFLNAEFHFDGQKNDGFYHKCKELNLRFFDDVKTFLGMVNKNG